MKYLKIKLIKLTYHMLQIDYKNGEMDYRTYSLVKWYLLRNLAKCYK